MCQTTFWFFWARPVSNSIHIQLVSWISAGLPMWVKFSPKAYLAEFGVPTWLHGGWSQLECMGVGVNHIYDMNNEFKINAYFSSGACKRLRPISPNTRVTLSFATNPTAWCRMPTVNLTNWLQAKHVDHIQYRKSQNTPENSFDSTMWQLPLVNHPGQNGFILWRKSSWLSRKRSSDSDASRQFPVFSPCK